MGIFVSTSRAALLAAPLALAGGMSFAGGLAAPVETVPPAALVPVTIAVGSDWTGAYGGVQLGYAEVTGTGTTQDVTGVTYGVHGGYLYDLGTLVLGAEVDYDLTNIDNVAGVADLDSILRVKARVGYDAGGFMPYVTGGVVRATTSGPDLELEGDLYGAGVAYRFSDRLIVTGEVLQHKFYEADAPRLPGTERATTASVRVSYQF